MADQKSKQSTDQGWMKSLILALQQTHFQNEVQEDRRQALLFKDLDINYNMFRILRYLSESPDGAEPSTLSNVLFILRPTVTNTLDHLEQRSLIRREPHPTDRRRVIVKLQPKGEETIQKALTLSHDYHDRILTHFSRDELEHYVAMRIRMAEIRDQAIQDILEERKHNPDNK